MRPEMSRIIISKYPGHLPRPFASRYSLTPSIMISPCIYSIARNRLKAKVDLPEPVAPTRPTCMPGCLACQCCNMFVFEKYLHTSTVKETFSTLAEGPERISHSVFSHLSFLVGATQEADILPLQTHVPT